MKSPVEIFSFTNIFVVPPKYNSHWALRLAFRVLMLRTCFETGLAVSAYFKYIVIGYGAASQDVRSTMLFGLYYGIFCLAFGFVWLSFGFATMSNEIANMFNDFIKEMREKLSTK